MHSLVRPRLSLPFVHEFRITAFKLDNFSRNRPSHAVQDPCANLIRLFDLALSTVTRG